MITGIGAVAPWARSGERAGAHAELVRRIWARDPSLWPGDAKARAEIAYRLGWLDVMQGLRPQVTELVWFARQLRRDGYTRAYLLGMGGSSLGPEVMKRVFGRQEAGMDLTVLDTTDPAAVAAAEKEGDLSKALFIVSSKSGSTVEVESLYRHFSSRVGGNGAQFLAVTDPGTSLQRLAWEYRFRRVFTNPPDIGGRYSVLSWFGMVPAALLGLDVGRLLDGGIGMARACGPGRATDENPGLLLGCALGLGAAAGRDKVTLVLDWRLNALGLWIEQLLAESTGKNGLGLVPVPAELPLAPPEAYAADRLFVATSLGAPWNEDTTRWLAGLERHGHPVVRLHLDSLYHLGAEFFRWEFATAVAGSMLGINAFDQPDVQVAKDRTRAILKEYEAAGTLPGNAAVSLDAELTGLLNRLKSGRDYLGLLAYLPFDASTERMFEAVRTGLRDAWKVPVTFGFGPRYLHSTGQLHKGGTASGSFLVITCDHAADLHVPGSPFTFGTLERAQALGDLGALQGRGRPVVRLHLPDAAPATVQALLNRLLAVARTPGMKALRAVWGDTRMVVLTAVSAALFAAILIPFKILPIIPGVTEIRPANAIPMVMSLLFGPAGAWGSAFGNLVGDFFLGLGPGSVFGMVGNFLYGFAPFALWRTLFGARMPDRSRWGDWVALMAIFAIAGAACAFSIAWGIDVVIGGVPFAILGSIIFFNNFVMSAVLAPPLLFALLPRVRAWGLLYTDILPPEATRTPRTAWPGAILFSAGAIGGLVFGMIVATGRYAQPVGIPQFWKALTRIAAPGAAAPSATIMASSMPVPARPVNASAPPVAKTTGSAAPVPLSATVPAGHRAGLGWTLAPALLLLALGVLLL